MASDQPSPVSRWNFKLDVESQGALFYQTWLYCVVRLVVSMGIMKALQEKGGLGETGTEDEDGGGGDEKKDAGSYSELRDTEDAPSLKCSIILAVHGCLHTFSSFSQP